MKLMAELQETNARYFELNDVFQKASKHSSEYPTSFVIRALTEAFKDLAKYIKSNYPDLYQERIA